MRKQTLKQLQAAPTEKDVENAYRAEIIHCRPAADISSPHKTDGYIRWDTVRLFEEVSLISALPTGDGVFGRSSRPQ